MGQQRFATSRGLLEDREEERKGPTGSPSRDGDSYPGAKYVFIGYSLGRAQLEAVGRAFGVHLDCGQSSGAGGR